MGVFDFIFGVIILVVVSITILGAIGMKTEAIKLSEENEELKKKLKRREYNEAKIKTKKEIKK